MLQRRKLVFFWDIDGTILDTKGLGKLPFNNALSNFFNQEIDLSCFNFAGYTDYEIIKYFADKFQYVIRDFEMEQILERYCADYNELLVNEKITAFEHVREFLIYDHPDFLVTHGIASGNCTGGGELKLKSSNLYDLFDEELFFSNSTLPSRDELIKFIKNKRGGAVVIIGDTPRDFYSARKSGLRIISVATGRYNFEELSKLNPGFVLNKLWSVKDMIGLMNKLTN